jgi:hypothetical protein
VKTKGIIAVALLQIVLSGCRETPGDMVGSSLADVERRFGLPDIKSKTTMPTEPTGVPGPVLLKPGDPYLFVEYVDLRGRQWHLTFVSAVIYARVKGKSPGSEPWYLLEAIDFDRDVVF